MNIKNLTKLDNFILQDRIGTSSLNETIKIKQNDANKTFAAKITFKPISDNIKSEKSSFQQDVKILSNVNHPSIIKVEYICPINFHNEDKPVIISEYMNHRSLSNIIGSTNKSYWTDTYKLICLYGISSALSCLHSHNYIFKNLKMSNVLFDEFLFPKIDCFGFSRFNESNECKIPRYIAPETWEQSIYSQESDVYSFGILMYEIITNQEAFCGNKFFEIPAKVTSGIRPEFKIQIQSPYKNLIEKCWSQNPSDRPTFNQILEELSDSQFITETIDEDYYLNYIDYINDYIEKISSFKDDISIEKFIKRKTKNFIKIESNEKNPNDEPIKNENNSKTTNKNCAQSEDPYPNIDNETKIMFNKAVNTLKGDGPLDNKKESLIILKNCADKGIVEAMALYSYFVRTGQFNPINNEEGLKYLKMAADNGHLQSKHNYASCAYEGIGMQKNKNEALVYYKLAADEGLIESINNYSILLSFENDEEMQKQAAHYCRIGIEKGSEKSMQLYASLLSLGIGVQKDYKESIKYYKMAIDKGDKKAIIGLASVLEVAEEAFLEKSEIAKYYKMAANMLEKGDEIQINKENAIHYYNLAANLGDEESKKKYENMINDESEKVNINALKKDADNGNIEAIMQYASMLYDGNGVPFDKFEASLYYEKAAKKGNIDAIEKLEKMFLYGIGVPANLKECIKILSFGIDKLNDNDLYEFCNSEIKNENRKISISKIEKYLRNLADKGHFYAICDFTKPKSIFQNTNRPIFVNKTKINADNGDPKAMYIYAMMKSNGYCTQIDEDEGKKYFELASQYGNIDAMYYNSNFHIKHPIDQDQSDYLKCLKKGADAGNVLCMFDYADIMYNGAYGPVNIKKKLLNITK